VIHPKGHEMHTKAIRRIQKAPPTWNRKAKPLTLIVFGEENSVPEPHKNTSTAI